MMKIVIYSDIIYFVISEYININMIYLASKLSMIYDDIKMEKRNEALLLMQSACEGERNGIRPSSGMLL